MNFSDAYGQRMDIRSHIKSKGITQRAIARKLKVSEASMSEWLDGKKAVPSRVLAPMAGIIGIKVDVLLAALVPPEVP